MKNAIPVLLLALVISCCYAQKTGQAGSDNKQTRSTDAQRIIPGAERINVYLPLIKGRKVGIFANQTSIVGNTHLVDTLKKLGIDIKVIFGPEHGFRGTADAGEKIGNNVDPKTGIPVVSLYGSKRRPSAEDVKDVDILIFDIQDVGVRFYTYISSLEEFMEAAFEMGKPLMILDRPNPNGHYVDGPVLDKKYKSFVGMQPVPVVYGMTIAEYAMMIAGEKWLSEKANSRYDYYKNYAQNSVDTPFHFQIIKNANYNHKSKYVLPVKPSPNLPNIQSVYLYPSTCFFEGTVLSEGRGTNKQFQVFGHPSLPKNLYSFTPNPNEGAKSSKLYGQVCYGWDLSGTPEEVLHKVDNKVQLKWLMEAYSLFPEKDKFFILPKSGKMEESFFNKLAGNNELWQQIKNGQSEAEIRKSWESKLSEFKKIRKKYLLYEDFE
ncbi:exo-beta-N-acetylmuramidase NamZ family protein [Terrimonas alba]|uniref:exo-beta-N-acetylmuramidase NamZ family protein n=1 Tax=Terrimonas alba TaxID=3349636 RepID=UPI0035F2B9CF